MRLGELSYFIFLIVHDKGNHDSILRSFGEACNDTLRRIREIREDGWEDRGPVALGGGVPPF